MSNKERIEIREKAYRMASELAIPGTGHLNILAEEIFQFLTKDPYPDPLRLSDPKPRLRQTFEEAYDKKAKQWAECIEMELLRNPPLFYFPGKPKEIDWSRPQLVATISGLVVKTTGSHSEPHFEGEVVATGSSSHKIGHFADTWLKRVFKYHGEIPEKEKTTGLNFLEAIELLKSGKAVGRPMVEKKHLSQYGLRGKYLCYLDSRVWATLNTDDFTATDWEIL